MELVLSTYGIASGVLAVLSVGLFLFKALNPKTRQAFRERRELHQAVADAIAARQRPQHAERVSDPAHVS